MLLSLEQDKEFRSVTRGYTGDQTLSIRGIDFNSHQFKEVAAALQKCHNEQWKALETAYQLT